jgi:hypothetical protein
MLTGEPVATPTVALGVNAQVAPEIAGVKPQLRVTL